MCVACLIRQSAHHMPSHPLATEWLGTRAPFGIFRPALYADTYGLYITHRDGGNASKMWANTCVLMERAELVYIPSLYSILLPLFQALCLFPTFLLSWVICPSPNDVTVHHAACSYFEIPAPWRKARKPLPVCVERGEGVLGRKLIGDFIRKNALHLFLVHLSTHC